uniref:uncharacterized protein LOC117604375 n=1 Tax=Osmia lignaria TaxID=473952 RepID=UPI0014786FB3|nr:uncharacterized protein LOC117604375 [Osmia lignaria]
MSAYPDKDSLLVSEHPPIPEEASYNASETSGKSTSSLPKSLNLRGQKEDNLQSISEHQYKILLQKEGKIVFTSFNQEKIKGNGARAKTKMVVLHQVKSNFEVESDFRESLRLGLRDS